MRNIKLKVAYDGTRYSGWQFQDHAISVQRVLEDAVVSLTGKHSRVIGASRTDAGVHARGQVAAFQTEFDLPIERLAMAINHFLPTDVCVTSAVETPVRFNVIGGAKRKTYRYVIQHGPVFDIFSKHQAWHVRQPLCIDAMHEGASLLLGKQDFATFQNAGSTRRTTVRTILDLQLNPSKQGDFDYIEMWITGDGFLYNMVRNIAGTLVQIGRHRRDCQWLKTALASRDRLKSGPTAPARGLFLERIEYDKQDWE